MSRLGWLQRSQVELGDLGISFDEPTDAHEQLLDRLESP